MTTSHHKRSLIKAIVLTRSIIWTTLILSSLLPPFDSSATLVLKKPFFSFLLRWDAFHFAHVAKEGYVYEHEFAFFPGITLLMRALSIITGKLGITSGSAFEGVLIGGAIASLASDAAVVVLYDLTNATFGSPSFAYLCSMMQLLSLSPATLRNAPYSEPFFSLLSYMGMLQCAKENWTRASIYFALATLFRSNGVMLCGFLVWGMIVEPFLRKPKTMPRMTLIAYCMTLCMLPLLSFGGFQYFAYRSFCLPAPTRPWCHQTPPLAYTYVQAKYWNSGPFLYWTVSQIPNFLLAGPVLLLLIHASTQHIRSTLIPQSRRLFLAQETKPTSKFEPLLRPVVSPHAIHALILSITLITSAHVQIVLRLASSMPFTYWAAGSLWVRLVQRKTDVKYARWWTTWSVVWCFISLVLWGTFLPPA